MALGDGSSKHAISSKSAVRDTRSAIDKLKHVCTNEKGDGSEPGGPTAAHVAQLKLLCSDDTEAVLASLAYLAQAGSASLPHQLLAALLSMLTTTVAASRPKSGEARRIMATFLDSLSLGRCVVPA